MKKDWTGNSKSIFTPHGATNHSEGERASEDYYATDPKAIDALFAVESFTGVIWEPACGEGHLSRRMKELGKDVTSTDLIDRGYGEGTWDFLQSDKASMNCDIITNPPYSFAQEFCEKAFSYNPNKVAMFLKLTFLEGCRRKKFFAEHPPRYVYVFSRRIDCYKNGDFSHKTGAVAYAWFVWYRGYKGATEIKWL
jgi:hypothetical protein